MFKAVSKQVRPNTTTEFWSARKFVPAACLAYFEKNYISTDKIIKTEMELSDDKLVLTTSTHWADEKYYLEFLHDQVIIDDFLENLGQYSVDNGIKLINVDLRNSMEVVLGPNPYPNLVIPETWANVEEFCNWWLSSGMPMLIPADAEVFISDDATAISLFRKGRFQVELYLIHPNPKVPVHQHPGVEVIKIRLNGRKRPSISNTLHDGESHGAGVRLEAEEKGYPLLAIQHWLTRDPTTVASMWKGNTVGPMQEALIKRFNAEALVREGWADITSKS
jgi:hypothetical protein